MGLDTLVRFFIFFFFTKESTFVTLFLLFCTLWPFWNGVYFKREEFAPQGSKFFPFNVDPLSEGRQKMLTVAFPQTVSIPLNFSKIEIEGLTSSWLSCGTHDVITWKEKWKYLSLCENLYKPNPMVISWELISHNSNPGLLHNLFQ